MKFSFYSQLSAAKYDETAIYFEAARLTFRDLLVKVDGLCAYLIGYGVRQGDRLMLLGGSAFDFVPLYFAASKLGLGLVYTMDIELPKLAEWTRVMASAEPDWIVVEPGVSLAEEKRCGLGSERVIELRKDYPVSGGFNIQPNAPQDVFIAIYNTVDATNNTPRATCFTEAGLAACARGIATEMQLGTGTTLLMNGLLCTLIGEVLSLAALGAGACLAICDPRDDKALRDQVLSSGATHLMLPPFLLAKAFELLTREEAHHNYSSVRLIAYGAAPADQAILKRAQELLDCEWLHGYGQTQTGGPIIWLRDKERRIGQTGVGTPTKDVSLAIIKSNGQQAAFGEVGEIGIRGSQVFAGYWDPEIGAAVPPEPLPGGWHRTFDLGEIDKDGNLHLRGRVRNVVLRPDGYTVNCDEVEAVLKSATAIGKLALVPWKPAGAGDEVAVLVFGSYQPRKDMWRLRQAANKLLSKKKNPDFIFALRPDVAFDRKALAEAIAIGPLQPFASSFLERLIIQIFGR